VHARPWTALTTCAVVAIALLAGCSSTKKPSNVQPQGGPTTSATKTTSPTPTGTPVSPFEDDPAVKALRAWTAQLAKTVNAGKTDEPALDALMTQAVKAGITKIIGGAAGLYMPGPLPFIPIQITKETSTQHNINICVVNEGFSQDPRTHKPLGVHTIKPIDAGADFVDGRWLVSGFFRGHFSCDGVVVPEPTW